MIIRSLWLGVVVLVVVLVVAGCSREPDSANARAELEAVRSEVEKELIAVAAVMVQQGWQVEDLSGNFTCSGGDLAPDRGTYGGGGRVVGVSGTVNEQVDAVAAALVEAGWTLSATGRTSARLTREGRKLKVDPNVRIGSNDVVFGTGGPFVEVTEQQCSDLITSGRKPITP